MTYVMSDIHGDYRRYLQMLELIGFSDEDELYVLGDVIDRGEEPLKVLLDMSMRPNVFPIMGNHELMAAWILRRLCVEVTEDNYAAQIDGELLEALSLWRLDGGDTTLAAFEKLEAEDREEILAYLEEFTPYEELTVGQNRFLLVHGGIAYDKRHIPMDEQDVRELVTVRPDYEKRYFDDRYLVTGHTPTVHIPGGTEGIILTSNGHIAVDCGAGAGIALGCIRLEDFEEFYV
ncbi:MAG: fructose-bisphosphatase class III [Ruminococcaceae bacterium]|nr:fructose-bisphosphatase class III [Oscillospiraceae bacterium]